MEQMDTEQRAHSVLAACRAPRGEGQPGRREGGVRGGGGGEEGK